MASIHNTDTPFCIISAVADKPDEPAPITTTSGLDCAKEIFGNAARASPDKDVFRNCLLPILFMLFISKVF